MKQTGSAICRRSIAVAVAVLAVIASTSLCEATQRFGPLELSGNLQSQNLVRHPDISEFQFVQQRNSARLRVDWDWMEGGRLLDRFDIPFVDSSHLFLLYRGVYDSIYDYTPQFRERQWYGTKPTPFSRARQLSDFSRHERDALKFESVLREAYADIKFADIPLSIRAGKQQIVWGESDNFRMLDRVNPLDVSWHMVQEVPPPAFGWDELRIPFWMIKGLWNFGNIRNYSNVFVEWFWNPGDWRPVKVSFLPRPWGLRILDPLNNPQDGGFNFLLAGQTDHLMNNTSLFKRGDYSRNPMDNSQVGIRLGATTESGFQFTVNYLHQRWSGDDGSPTAPVIGVADTPEGRLLTDELTAEKTLPAEYFTPYIHTVGLSANFFEGSYTQTVFRAETIYDFRLPFYRRSRETTLSPFLPGNTRRDMWKAMLAFDRPTWIRSLNKKTTFFITGQYFIHHIMHNSDDLVGPLDIPSAGSFGRLVADSYRDDIRSWEMLTTLAIFTFYKGGSVVPMFVYVLDPINSYSMEVIWYLDWYVTPNFAVNLSQRYFAHVGSRPFDPWLLAASGAGRSETGLRLTYQF